MDCSQHMRAKLFMSRTKLRDKLCNFVTIVLRHGNMSLDKHVNLKAKCWSMAVRICQHNKKMTISTTMQHKWKVTFKGPKISLLRQTSRTSMKSRFANRLEPHKTLSKSTGLIYTFSHSKIGHKTNTFFRNTKNRSTRECKYFSGLVCQRSMNWLFKTKKTSQMFICVASKL